MRDWSNHINGLDDFLGDIQQKTIQYRNELKNLFGDDSEFGKKLDGYIASPININLFLNIGMIDSMCEILVDQQLIKEQVINCLNKNNLNIEKFSFELFQQSITFKYDFIKQAKYYLGEDCYDDSIKVLEVLLKIAFCRYVGDHSTEIMNRFGELIFEHGQKLDEHEKRISKLEDKNTFEEDLDDYYRTYQNKYKEKSTSKVLGEYSLEDTYYPAYDENHKQIIDRIKEWVQPQVGNVMLLHGEPGHGKTSFCYYVVNQFIQKKYFSNMKNVFYFNLNPGGWSNRVDKNHNIIDTFFLNNEIKFKLKDCKNSIVFLDGYDELKGNLGKEKLKDYKSYEGINHLISELQGYANTYSISFIVTTRTSAISNELEELKKKDDLTVIEFAHLKVEDQDEWVKQFDQDGSTKYQDEWRALKESKLYPKFFYKKEDEASYSFRNKDKPSLLGIPILFRIVILNPLNKEGDIKNKAHLYEQLLKVTLQRDDSRYDRRDYLIEKYQNLAFRIFANLEQKDTITDLSNDDNELLFSYYLKGNQYELGFIHRSFYQYFLTKFLYDQIKKASPKDYLPKLLYRRLDVDELAFLKEIYDLDEKKEVIKGKYELIMDELVTTKGVVNDTYHKRLPTLQQFHNVTYNIIDMMSRLELKIMLDTERYRPLISLLRNMDITNLDLSYQEFTRVDFSRMKFTNVSLSHTKCRFCKFNDSSLRYVNFKQADLTGSRMKNCELNGAYFEKTIIDFVDFRGSNFNKEKEEGKVVYKNYQKEEYEVYNEGIKIGTYREEEIKGRALDLTKEKELVVITEQIIECLPYNEEWEETNWSECTLRKALNGDKKEEIVGIVNQIEDSKVIKRIKQVTIENEDNEKYRTKGGPETTDRMYLLSIKEAEEYFIDNIDREATGIESIRDDKGGKLWVYSGGTSPWWLRSPGALGDYAAFVFIVGSVTSIGTL